MQQVRSVVVRPRLLLLSRLAAHGSWLGRVYFSFRLCRAIQTTMAAAAAKSSCAGRERVLCVGQRAAGPQLHTYLTQTRVSF